MTERRYFSLSFVLCGSSFMEGMEYSGFLVDGGCRRQGGVLTSPVAVDRRNSQNRVDENSNPDCNGTDRTELAQQKTQAWSHVSK